MELRNHTPFPPLFFESRDTNGQAFGVLVVRGTFVIRDGEALRPHPEQHPIVEQDVYAGEPGQSSLKMESDLAPFKPATDVTLSAVARAPHGQPAAQWLAQVRVGYGHVEGRRRSEQDEWTAQRDHYRALRTMSLREQREAVEWRAARPAEGPWTLDKTLRVRGPRQWKHRRLGGWQLTDPAPCTEVPLRYEHAFGGGFDLMGTRVAYDRNPVGQGFFDPLRADRSAAIPAPQIEDPYHPVETAGETYAPQGVGPIARHWAPRPSRAGSFDADWLAETWPNLPADFDFSFYQCAHPDLTCPGFVAGDETVALLGMHAEAPEVWFRLPAYEMAALLRREDGSMTVAPLFLDTAHFDVAAPQIADHRAHLTWRGFFLLDPPLRVIEARMEQRQPGELPRSAVSSPEAS